MQNIYSNYYKKNIAPNIIPLSQNRNYETSFFDMSCGECK